MRRFTFIYLLIALAGCGSDNASKLNASFAGQWNGPATANWGGTPVTDPAVQVTLMLASDTTVTIAPVCPENQGSLTGSGSGNNASWTGSYVCPAVAVGQCASVVVTLTGGQVTLSSDARSLTATASGTAAGCSQTGAFSWSFSGTK